MRDLFLLIVVAAMFAGGYFIMDRLDPVLEKLRPQEDLSGEEPEAEISQPSQVENSCLLCYNNKCKKRVRYPAARLGGQEETAWKQSGGTRICFCAPFGTAEKHRES